MGRNEVKFVMEQFAQGCLTGIIDDPLTESKMLDFLWLDLDWIVSLKLLSALNL